MRNAFTVFFTLSAPREICTRIKQSKSIIPSRFRKFFIVFYIWSGNFKLIFHFFTRNILTENLVYASDFFGKLISTTNLIIKFDKFIFHGNGKLLSAVYSWHKFSFIHLVFTVRAFHDLFNEIPTLIKINSYNFEIFLRKNYRPWLFTSRKNSKY